MFRLTLAAATLCVAVATAEPVRQPSAWFEGFEGPQTTWRLVGSDARCQVDFHQRVRGEAATGDGSEYWRVSATPGTHVYVGHDVGRPRVIADLLPSVRVKSDRPGLQLLAEVVLPRFRDPRTGHAVSTLIEGSRYGAVGQWQELRIDNIPQRLDRRKLVLQGQWGASVDCREAYVQQILLNVYGGSGVTQVWIDDLDVAGHAPAPPDSDRLAEGRSSPARSANGSRLPTTGDGWGRSDSATDAGRSERVRLEGSVLLVDNRPFFPRAIRHQGEPLGLLKQLGFNTVWLGQLPDLPLLEEADRLGLWLVSAPPIPPWEVSDAPFREPPPAIGPEYDRVLAWDLGRDLAAEHLDETRRWAERLRTADRRGRRPLICSARSDLRAYSRNVDLLLVTRPVLSSSLELTDYGTWVRSRPRLARPGTTAWTTVATQPSAELLQQWDVLGGGRKPPLSISSEQVRLLAYTAVSSGSRGLLFESSAALDADDPDTRHRAAALELLNLELALVEPWMAAGTWNATIEGTEKGILGGVIETERSRLLVALWTEPGAQFTAGQSAANGVSLVVPGIPDSNDAYLLLPGSLPPVPHKRETGGTRVTLDEFGLTALVLFTQDPLTQNSLYRQARKIGPRAAQLQCQLAREKLRATEEVVRQMLDARMTGRAGAEDDLPWERRLLEAKTNLQRADGYLAAQDNASAYLHAQRAMRPMRLLQRALWEREVASVDSPIAVPVLVSFWTLPWHRQFVEQTASARWSPNLIAASDFEDLAAWLSAGWNHYQRAAGDQKSNDEIFTEADLSPMAARSGQLGLRISAYPADPDRAPPLVETPPAWITTPPVEVQRGSLVAIHGWINVPTAITGSVDGVLILDSLSGEPLAQRIGQTVGWREFTLWRAVPRSGPLVVTFALSGFGEAWLDDVSVHTMIFDGPEPARQAEATRLPGEPFRPALR
jgi:hypothetical protein